MNSMPSKNEEYAKLEYWNERYKSEESYEWFKSYADFRHIIRSVVEPRHKILMLGCGNSRLSEEMYADGYENICNVDYSPVVIDRMRSRCQSIAPRMQWLVADVTRQLPDFFPRQSFDAVVEKGTLDAMLVGEKDPWSISAASEQSMNNILNQISRLLRPDGRFVSITFTQPHFRRRLYAKREYDWSFRHYEFGESFAYFVYVMTKGEPLSDEVVSRSAVTSRADESHTSTKRTIDDRCDDFLSRIDCIN